MSRIEHTQVGEVRRVIQRHGINLGSILEWECPSLKGTDLNHKMLILYLALEGTVKPEDAARLRSMGVA